MGKKHRQEGEEGKGFASMKQAGLMIVKTKQRKSCLGMPTSLPTTVLSCFLVPASQSGSIPMGLSLGELAQPTWESKKAH